MTAIIYNFVRADESTSEDESERLLTALGRYTVPELLELLYVGEEPDFFELMRGVFSLPDDSRSILQQFLTEAPLRKITASIDSAGRCVLTLGTFEGEKPIKGIAH